VVREREDLYLRPFSLGGKGEGGLMFRNFSLGGKWGDYSGVSFFLGEKGERRLICCVFLPWQ
jgi:hypothetical protein